LLKEKEAMTEKPTLSPVDPADVKNRGQGNSDEQYGANSAQEHSPLTDYQYGSHCGAETGADVVDYLQTGLSSTNTLSHPYHVRFGGKQPEGVERYAMYGMGPDDRVRAPEYEAVPAPVPAALGLNVNDKIGSTVPPHSDAQLAAVIEERFAETVDPGTVSVEAHEGIVTLRGTVRDAATCEILETEARNCPGTKAVHSELSARTRFRKNNQKSGQ